MQVIVTKVKFYSGEMQIERFLCGLAQVASGLCGEVHGIPEDMLRSGSPTHGQVMGA
jgi:hypothetical protein